MAAKKTSAKISSAKKDVKAAVEKLDQAQDKMIDVAEEAVNNRLESVKQVWFASLGAVGRSVDEVKERYSQAGEELQARYAQLRNERESLLGDLVSRGEAVQDQAEVRFKEGRATVEERIDDVKGRLSSAVDIPSRLKDLSDKLETLSKDLKKTA